MKWVKKGFSAGKIRNGSRPRGTSLKIRLETRTSSIEQDVEGTTWSNDNSQRAITRKILKWRTFSNDFLNLIRAMLRRYTWPKNADRIIDLDYHARGNGSRTSRPENQHSHSHKPKKKYFNFPFPSYNIQYFMKVFISNLIKKKSETYKIKINVNISYITLTIKKCITIYK